MNLKPFVYQAIIDSLDSLIAIIDEKGNVLATNKMWQKQAVRRGLLKRVDCVGYNYIEVCEKTRGEGRSVALKIARGIKKVISGEDEIFKEVYSFVDENGEIKYFMVKVLPVKNVSPKIFAVVHEDVTDLKYIGRILSITDHGARKGVRKKEISEGKERSLQNLTAKELQIAILVKEGFSSKEIAQILNLSKDSIDFYRKRIRKKLGLKGRGISLNRYFQELEQN